MGKRAKNHHIVPEVLQRQFAIADDPKRIWRAKRHMNGNYRKLERKLINKSFVIRDYYTILENDERSDRVERDYYGMIDNFLGQWLPEVIGIFQEGKIPSFNPKNLDDTRKVVMAMLKRTPDFIKDLDDFAVGRDLVETCLREAPEDTSASQREIWEAELADEQRLRDIGRHIRVAASLKNSQRIEEALAERSPRWAISETKHSYVLSSMMAYRIGNGGPNGLSNPEMEIWMPITPKIAFVLVRDPDNTIPMIVKDEPEHIRQINEYAMNNCFELASHSELLLKSLLRQ
ncbi:DUF4238 domain-containing protein [Labrenzia sp. 011]|uniref:DUF4238 domain-containing protein n=1 Tax=Labrenzia sp. 011 TaxID=2171494 RepID=UPI000D50E922|nr:DUF4238 domain-containing protein [Labrenzia sp. 011]PVB63432.1 hypothetical protein DCO57_01055 [Labrenzia sp. 011]